MSEVASQVDISKSLSIPGWMSERELTWLATQAQKNQLIVEFGCFHGRSTRALADNNNGIIWAIDPWLGEYLDEEGQVLADVNTFVMPDFCENLDDHIRMFHVFPVRTFSYNFRLPHTVDMVFLDGDHRYNTVVRDINTALSMLKSGGIISGHDYEHPRWPGVKKAVDEMLKDVQIEETIWWTTKSL